MNWITHFFGLDNGSGRWYLWWSGMGANFGEFAILGGLVAHYRRHTCHVDSPRYCWRPGLHPVAGTPYRTCKKHHPTVPDQISASSIGAEHAQAQLEGRT